MPIAKGLDFRCRIKAVCEGVKVSVLFPAAMVHGIGLEEVHHHAQRRHRRLPLGHHVTGMQGKSPKNRLPILQGGANPGMLIAPFQCIRRNHRRGRWRSGQRSFRFKIQTFEPAGREDFRHLLPRGKAVGGKLSGHVVAKIPARKRIAIHGEEISRRHHGDVHLVTLAGVEEQA